MDIAEKRRKKNEYMKEYLRRWRKTDHGRAIQKAIKRRQTVKLRIIHNLPHLTEVVRDWVRSHGE